MSLCFPELRVESESGLMILGLQACSSIRSKRSKSLTAYETKIIILTSRSIVSLSKRRWKLEEENFVTLHNNIQDKLRNFQSTPKIHKFFHAQMNKAQSSVSLMFLPHFDVICDLLLNRSTATWNLFVKYQPKLYVIRSSNGVNGIKKVRLEMPLKRLNKLQ